MLEVYAGHKPGRKNLAILLSGALLVGTLGLALVQVRGSFALAEPVRIPDTKLTVRPPKGWQQMADRPNTFVLVADDEEGDLAQLRARRLRFFSGRRGALASPHPVPAALDDVSGYQPLTRGPEPVDPIAGLPAYEQVWQVVRLGTFRRQPVRYDQTVIVRDAVSPAGDYIHVEYEPLSDRPTAGDRLLLDAICAAIEFEGTAASAALGDPLQHAGVSFPLTAGWQAAAFAADVPALRVGKPGLEPDAWSVAVFRASLASDDDPALALRRLSRSAWSASPRFMEFRSGSRADGSRVLRAAYTGRRYVGRLQSVWLVLKPNREAAVLLAQASPDRIDEAQRAAHDIAENVEMTSGAVPPIPLDDLLALLDRGQ